MICFKGSRRSDLGSEVPLRDELPLAIFLSLALSSAPSGHSRHFSPHVDFIPCSVSRTICRGLFDFLKCVVIRSLLIGDFSCFLMAVMPRLATVTVQGVATQWFPH